MEHDSQNSNLNLTCMYSSKHLKGLFSSFIITKLKSRTAIANASLHMISEGREGMYFYIIDIQHLVHLRTINSRCKTQTSVSMKRTKTIWSTSVCKAPSQQDQLSHIVAKRTANSRGTMQ